MLNITYLVVRQTKYNLLCIYKQTIRKRILQTQTVHLWKKLKTIAKVCLEQ